MMDPRYLDEAQLHAMGVTEASPVRGQSPAERYDMEAESEFGEPFYKQLQVPRWDSKLLSGRGHGPAIPPVWELWRSSKEGTEEGKTNSSSTPLCHLCAEHAGDSDKSESDSQSNSTDTPRWPSRDLQLRLVGLTVLAALLLFTVVAVTTKINRVILTAVDTESPDATGKAQLVDSRGEATDSGLPNRLLPDLIGKKAGSSREVDDDDDRIVLSTDVNEEERDAGSSEDADDERGESAIPDPSASEVPPDSGDNYDMPKKREDEKGGSYPAQEKPNCLTVMYTYCTEAKREFHYRASVNSCLATSLDPVVQLCARGKNRFASLADCEHSCALRERPRDACFETPIFTGCNREDVRDSWWFYEGGRCHLWSFPSGTCPSNGSAVFATAAECSGKCAGHRGRQRYPPCSKPRAVPCERRNLRFPYFAHFSMPEGRATCLRASAAVVSGHRCLAGRNRFPSLADCKESCIKKTP